MEFIFTWHILTHYILKVLRKISTRKCNNFTKMNKKLNCTTHICCVVCSAKPIVQAQISISTHTFKRGQLTPSLRCSHLFTTSQTRPAGSLSTLQRLSFSLSLLLWYTHASTVQKQGRASEIMASPSPSIRYFSYPVRLYLRA